MKYKNRQRFIILRFGLILGLIIPALLAAQTDEGEDEEELVVLTPFEVTEDEDRGYTSLYTLGATRINTSLDKVPASVLVLNEEFIQLLGWGAREESSSVYQRGRRRQTRRPTRRTARSTTPPTAAKNRTPSRLRSP